MEPPDDLYTLDEELLEYQYSTSDPTGYLPNEIVALVNNRESSNLVAGSHKNTYRGHRAKGERKRAQHNEGSVFFLGQVVADLLQAPHDWQLNQAELVHHEWY